MSQTTLRFKATTSSSSSATSSGRRTAVCSLSEANKTSLIKDPLQYYKIQYGRALPKPNLAGTSFALFLPSVVGNPKKSGKRTVTKTPEELVAWGNAPVKQPVPVMAHARAIISTNASCVTPDTGKAASTYMLESPVAVYSCLPCVQMRSTLLECPYAQVKDSEGVVIGVRAPCPCCETNEFVMYKNGPRTTSG